MSEPIHTLAAELAARRSDPQAFQLRGNPPRVMHLSRKTLAVVGVGPASALAGR